MLAPSGDRAVPAFFDLLYCYHNACPKWRQGGAGIFLFAILLPQCLLQVETERCRHCLSCYIVTTMLAPSGDRAVPALFDLLYCYHTACSKWRPGDARIV